MPNKTETVFIDVDWHTRRPGDPPDRVRREVRAAWDVAGGDYETSDHHEEVFSEVEDAVAWGRERAEVVLVRYGPTEDKVYSAGERRATRELPEFGGTDLTPYAEWDASFAPSRVPKTMPQIDETANAPSPRATRRTRSGTCELCGRSVAPWHRAVRTVYDNEDGSSRPWRAHRRCMNNARFELVLGKRDPSNDR